MWNFGDNEFPYPSFLKVPFVFVPKGNPLPLDWMAAHPNFVTFAATFLPRPQPGLPPEAEPGTASPPPEADRVQNHHDDIMMEGDPRLTRPLSDQLLKIVPPPRPLLPQLVDTRPEWIRRILPPPRPSETADKLPSNAGFGAFHANQADGMDVALRMMDAVGQASVVRAGMKHLDSHQGNVGAAIAAAKAAGGANALQKDVAAMAPDLRQAEK